MTLSTMTTTTPPADAHRVKLEAPPWQHDPREDELSAEEMDYLFDLRGFRILRGALSAQQREAINAFVDTNYTDDLEAGAWIGDVESHSYGKKDGINFQNIIEGGPVFEECIDHPAWYEQVRRYIALDSSRLSIDENFLNVRRSGGFIPVHSGGNNVRFTATFRNHAGKWMVGQINILMALTDVGHGDGCTTLIPGSHKSHEIHPVNIGDTTAWQRGVSGNDAVGMVQMHLKAGDALMFTDAVTHGSIPRSNPGERRVMIYRYAPHLLAGRFNYIPSDELLARLTDRRREIVQPVPPRLRPGRTITGASGQSVSGTG